MIEPNIYCKVAGMAAECIRALNIDGVRMPTVVEIGCAEGFGTRLFAGFCGRVVCVDPMVRGRPDFYGVGSPRHDDSLVAEFCERLREFPVELVVGLSQDPRTRGMVVSALGNSTADILIIDGAHHPRQAVQDDFDLYSPLVSIGGFVIFDDLYEIEDILSVYESALRSGQFVEHERWKCSDPKVLQECAAMRRIT